MDHEDDILVSQYSEYRKALRDIEPCMSFMPYGWFAPPKTVRLDAEFGRQQMVYRDLADDAARDLANGINHLTGLTMRLEAWSKVIQGLDVHDKNLLLHVCSRPGRHGALNPASATKSSPPGSPRRV
jgi:hypothetical protein